MTTRLNVRILISLRILLAGALSLATEVTSATDLPALSTPRIVVVADTTTTLQFVDVDAEMVDDGVHVSGFLRSKRLQRRLLQNPSPRVLVIQLRHDSGEVRATKRIELSAHALHQHGSQPFRFDVILDGQSAPGDSVILKLEYRGVGRASPNLQIPQASQPAQDQE